MESLIDFFLKKQNYKLIYLEIFSVESWLDDLPVVGPLLPLEAQQAITFNFPD